MLSYGTIKKDFRPSVPLERLGVNKSLRDLDFEIEQECSWIDMFEKKEETEAVVTSEPVLVLGNKNKVDIFNKGKYYV